jgi:translation initiation factor IF-1
MTEIGTVLEALPALSFRVKLDKTQKEILAYLAGKMRRHHIKVLPGDKVTVETTPYDDRRGRIIRRL